MLLLEIGCHVLLSVLVRGRTPPSRPIASRRTSVQDAATCDCFDELFLQGFLPLNMLTSSNQSRVREVCTATYRRSLEQPLAWDAVGSIVGEPTCRGRWPQLFTLFGQQPIPATKKNTACGQTPSHSTRMSDSSVTRTRHCNKRDWLHLKERQFLLQWDFRKISSCRTTDTKGKARTKRKKKIHPFS